jgi:hypothetical protein
MPDNRDTGLNMLHNAGLDIDCVFDQPLPSLQVSGTPTLLLLDSQGRVAREWVGQLDEKGDEDVHAAVER